MFFMMPSFEKSPFSLEYPKGIKEKVRMTTAWAEICSCNLCIHPILGVHAGGTTTRMWEIESRLEQRSRATLGAVAEGNQIRKTALLLILLTPALSIRRGRFPHFYSCTAKRFLSSGLLPKALASQGGAASNTLWNSFSFASASVTSGTLIG
jgi:hypothetical protein